MPAQTLGLLSLARRGRGLQGQVPSCPSLFVLRGPGSPRPPAPSPPRARPTQWVLLAEVLVLSLVQGLLVEFHFRLQYRLVFRCVPCLLCWGEALNTPSPPTAAFCSAPLPTAAITCPFPPPATPLVPPHYP